MSTKTLSWLVGARDGKKLGPGWDPATDLPMLTPPLSTVDWFQLPNGPNYSWTKNVVKIAVTFELIVQF